MRRIGTQASGAAFLVALFATACGDGNQGTTGPTSGPPLAQATAAAVAPPPATCTTYAALVALTKQVFGESPATNIALAKLTEFNRQLDLGNIDAAQTLAFDFVEFLLDKFRLGGLPGTPAQVTSLANGVLCYAGLAVQITDPANSFVVLPADAPQVLVHSNGLSGTALPANAVAEPSLITIHPIPNTFPTPGSGPLNTKLDQYPGFIAVTKSSENNAPLSQPVVVGVCPAPGIPASVLARLRLGHDAAAGFEITPPADASFLRCPTSTADARPRSWLRSLASLVLPRPLYARQDEFRGGVGGTAGEYSEFAPVDPEVGLSGGVGGTAGEYIRALPPRQAPRLETLSPAGMLRTSAALMSGNGCNPIEAPIGTPVDDACVPFVHLKTRLGTPFVGVPVSWAVTAGAGSIAPRSLGVCGLFGSTASTTSAPSGKTGVCWTLGVAGTNTVVATPRLGGDAIAGVVINPPTVSFNAIANPPVGIEFDQIPPNTITAGAPFTVTAKVIDKYRNQVLGSNHAITLSLNQFTFATGLASLGANAVQGYVTFTGLRINRAATGYRLTANGSFIAAPFVPPVSNAFSVVAASPFSMSIVTGNNQAAATGAILPVDPTVLVSDQFENPVPDVDVLWTLGASSGSVNPALSETDNTGKTFTRWTIGAGNVTLTASVVGSPALTRTFAATGNSALVVLNRCEPGGSGDPINHHNKTYAFYLPNPGPNKTIREIELYFSSTGRANSPTTYSIQLTTQLGSFNPAVSTPVATIASVVLRGNNSEKAPATFKLTTPIVGSESGPPVMIRLAVVSNPDDAKISFNTGPCSPGNHCYPPSGCRVTEVNSVTPYPLGTTYRKSVAITVRGN